MTCIHQKGELSSAGEFELNELTFPEDVTGKLSTKRTYWGILKLAI